MTHSLSFKAVRELCKKKRMKRLSPAFDALSSEHIKDIAKIRPCTDELFRLVLDLINAYSEEKNKRGVLDFNDLEHLALKLLTDPVTGQPTVQAVQLSQRFEEILVDEYQDANRSGQVFTAVSREGKTKPMLATSHSRYTVSACRPPIIMRNMRC
jgi:ATP-dependent helicase/nuclease subunit A